MSYIKVLVDKRVVISFFPHHFLSDAWSVMEMTPGEIPNISNLSATWAAWSRRPPWSGTIYSRTGDFMGQNTGKTIELQYNNMVSCRFSLKAIYWTCGHFPMKPSIIGMFIFLIHTHIPYVRLPLPMVLMVTVIIT